MTQSKPALRIAKHVIKERNFPADASVFSSPDEEASWNRIQKWKVLENHPTLENGVYGNRVHPVNCPANSFFIPDSYFTSDFFSPTLQPVKFDQPFDVRR